MLTPTVANLLSPSQAIQAALKSHPAFKYAMSVLGLAAVVAVAVRFGPSIATLVFGTIVLFVLMVLFVVFAQAAQASKAVLSLPAIVLVWSSLILVICAAMGLLTSAFWNIPLPLKDKIVQWLDLSSHNTGPNAGARHPDAAYVPPRGPLIRTEGNIPIASSLLCPGLLEEERTACLCPRPLNFKLAALPAPAEDNFATEIEITTPREPMYRIRVFLRDTISGAHLLAASPHEGKGVSSYAWSAAYDRYSFGAASTAPQSVFRVKLLSATGIRVICANQEN